MRTVLLISIFAISVFGCKAQNNMKVVYVYDALCGWCYGFSPVMTQFQEKYKESVDFEVISGGMITGQRIGPIGEVAPYISRAYKDVERATGVKFGSDFLDKTLKDGSAIFSSIPPAIALSIFKEIKPELKVQFASALQKAIYYDGIEPETFEAYGKIASAFGIDAKTFTAKMQDPKYAALAEQDFKKSADLNVNGFPSIFVEKDGTYKQIGNGYLPLERLEKNFLAVSKN